MLKNLEGLVLRTTKYSESSIITSVYTNLYGLQTYMMNGVRSAKSRTSPAMFQPGTFIDFVAYQKENSNINRIKEVKTGVQFEQIPFHLNKGAVLLFITEICSKSIREEEENIELFIFLKQAYFILDKHTGSIANFPLIFMLQLSAYLGFFPNNENKKETSFFDLQEGEFVEKEPHHFHYLDKELSEHLNNLLLVDLEYCDSVNVPKHIRTVLLEKIILYYKIHFQGSFEIHTHTIYAQVFMK